MKDKNNYMQSSTKEHNHISIDTKQYHAMKDIDIKFDNAVNVIRDKIIADSNCFTDLIKNTTIEAIEEYSQLFELEFRDSMISDVRASLFGDTMYKPKINRCKNRITKKAIIDLLLAVLEDY